MRNNQSGFTLTEVLVALTIFAVGLLAIASMQFTAIRANSLANIVTSRASLAQHVLEEILSKDSASFFFDSDATDVVWDLDPDIDGTSHPETTIELDGSGTCSAKYSLAINTPVQNVTEVTVTVTVGNRQTTLVGYKRSL